MQNEELKRSHLELDKARARYLDLYDQAPVGYFTLSEKGLILEANLTAATLLGIAREALAKQPITQFIHNEDQDIFYLLRKQLLESNERQSCELRMVRNAGKSFWVHLEASTIKDDSIVSICYIVMSDISERKKAEEKTQRDESRLRKLVDILQHSSETIQDFLDYALDQAILLTDSRIGYIYHYDENSKKFILNTWSKEVMAECSVANPSNCYELDKTGIWGEAVRQRRPIIVNDFQLANPLKKGYPDGHVQLLNSMTVPIFKNDSIVGVVGVANKEINYDESDILQLSLLMEAVWKVTDRKLAEEMLLESEIKYRRLFEAAKEGILILDAETEMIVDVNPFLVELLGYSSELFLGKTIWDIGFFKDIIKNKDKFLELQEKEYVRYDDLPLETAYGKVIEEEFISNVYEINHKKVIQCNIRDIAERKQSEKEKVEFVTRLQQAQKMEAIGSLAGGIAHDLNNILFPISGLSEILLDEIPPENPAHESLEQIHKSAQRGSDLVKQILAFSRHSNLLKLPVRIQPILKEALKLSRAVIPMNIGISSHINADCGMVSADPTQLHQIMMNLITNAYHAVEGIGGTIHIALKETEIEEDLSPFNAMKPGKYACLSISDTGTGIEKCLIDKLFEPYFTTKAQGKGTGLGLSVVYGIVKEHNGDIRVYSEIEKGTTFHVYLPLLEATKASQPVSIIRKYPTGCENILLVDDEEPIIRMEQMMLERLVSDNYPNEQP